MVTFSLSVLKESGYKLWGRAKSRVKSVVHLGTRVIHQYSLFLPCRPELLCGDGGHPCRQRGEDGRVYHLSLHLRGRHLENRAPGHVHQTRMSPDVGPARLASARRLAQPGPAAPLGNAGRTGDTFHEEPWGTVSPFAFLGHKDCKRKNWTYFKTSTRT